MVSIVVAHPRHFASTTTDDDLMWPPRERCVHVVVKSEWPCSPYSVLVEGSLAKESIKNPIREIDRVPHLHKAPSFKNFFSSAHATIGCSLCDCVCVLGQLQEQVAGADTLRMTIGVASTFEGRIHLGHIFCCRYLCRGVERD